MYKIGVLLLVIGIICYAFFGGMGILAFLASPEVPLLAKVGMFGIAGGTLLIILSSIKNNWGKKDKYDEVKE